MSWICQDRDHWRWWYRKRWQANWSVLHLFKLLQLLGSDRLKKGTGLPVKMITAAQCASEAIQATDSRRHLLVTPSWYLPILYLRKFFPSFVDYLLVKTFAPTPKKKESSN